MLLEWEAAGGATAYRVYTADNPGVTEGDQRLAETSDTTQVHGSLDPAVTYYYRLSAVNQWSEGPLSDEVSAQPLPPPAPPPPQPTGVAATPGDGQVVVSWDATPGADTYRLYWGLSSGTATNTIYDVSSPYTHSGLVNGTPYYYRVSAYGAGGEGPLSIEVSAVPQVAAPGAPGNVTATPGDGIVTLSWTAAAGALSYTIYWATQSPVGVTSSAITEVPGPPYVHLGRANGTTYYYRASATNPGGESPLSLEVSATPQPPAPSTPGFVEAQPGDNQVTVSWGSVSGAETYEVFWDTQSGVSLADTSIVGLLATNVVHTEASNGVRYYYRVRARNGGGTSSLSQEVSATPQPPPPASPPGSVEAIAGTRQVTVSWEAVSRAETYEVFWDTQPGVTLADNSIADNAATTMVHTELSNGVTYYYRVRARNGGGASSLSQEALAMPQFSASTQDKLMAGDAASSTRFGTSVAMSGEYLVAGASRAVYVFERLAAEWQQVQKLEGGHSFGWSVTISGNYLVVGAMWDNDGGTHAGAAYVFERTAAGWQEVQKLVVSDAQPYDDFGASVAISNDTLVVGATGVNAGAPPYEWDAGAAYVFERAASGWQEVTKLMASDVSSGGTLFGESVANSGGYLVVGASGYGGGAAYVFEHTAAGWQEVARLTAAYARGFGGSVAMSGEYLVVGASLQSGGGLGEVGAAYVFERAGTAWQEVNTLRASDGQPWDNFGDSVAISGDYLVAGAPGEDGGEGNPRQRSGAAYLFQRTAAGWEEIEKLMASDTQAEDKFGASVAISGDYLVVGADGEDGGAGDLLNGAGAAYVF